MNDVNKAIEDCLKKLNLKKQAHLCNYLPDSQGRRIHHKTFLKMLKYKSTYLADMLSDYILRPKEPALLPKTKRAPKTKEVYLSEDTSKLLKLAIERRDDKLFHMIYPKLPSNMIKSYLWSYIKDNRDDSNIANFVFTVMKKKRFIFRLDPS